MRKTVCIVLILFFIVLFSSCEKMEKLLFHYSNSSQKDLMYNSENQRIEKRIKLLIEAINNNDAEAIKSTFSKTALSEVDDIDAQVEYLFEFVDGKILSWEKDIYSSSSRIEYGKSTDIVLYDLFVTTDVDKYNFFITDYSVNTRDPDSEGIYMIEIYKGEWTSEWMWQERMCAGIHEPMLARVIGPDDSIPTFY